MQNTSVRLIRSIVHLVIFLTFFATANAQTSSCDVTDGGAVGHQLSGSDPVSEFCSIAPADVVWGNGQLTCRNCFPGGGGQAPQFSKGGTANCTAYDQQMIIDFAQPVADLNWEIYGARTVTDNRGYTVYMNPALYPDGHPMNSVMARFPGGGITRLVISDPIVYDLLYPNGTVEAPGFWQIDSINVLWTPGSTYDQCNCNRPTIPAPPTQNISTGWPFDLSGVDPNWSMLVQMTPNDGLVLRDIKLGQRYMVERISVPYFYLETSALTKTRGELKPDGLDTQMRSRLVRFYTAADDTKLIVEATYIIDQIPAGSQSCLEITQRYELYRTKVGDNCEPSSTLPCSRWKPIVKYRFVGSNGEVLRSLNIAQRQHHTIDNNSFNSVGIFRDSDGLGSISHGDGFEGKYNPLPNEWMDPIIIGGKRRQAMGQCPPNFQGSY